MSKKQIFSLFIAVNFFLIGCSSSEKKSVATQRAIETREYNVDAQTLIRASIDTFQDLGQGLMDIIYELEREKIEKERSLDRKSKIGTGDRSERIRTYNFPQGRVTDHRINVTLHKLTEFLSGDAFEEINDVLRIKDQEIKLENLNN